MRRESLQDAVRVALTMGWREAYELLAKLLKSSTRLRWPKPQEEQTRPTYARDVAGNPSQIPNPYLDGAHIRDERKSAQTAGRWRAAIRRAKTLRANLRRGIEAH